MFRSLLVSAAAHAIVLSFAAGAVRPLAFRAAAWAAEQEPILVTRFSAPRRVERRRAVRRPVAAAESPRDRDSEPASASEPIGGGEMSSRETVSSGQLLAWGNRLPEYPPEALEEGLEGTVRLLLELDAEGAVSKVEVLESSGSALLDAAAVRAAKDWRAPRAGSRRIVVPVRFKLVQYDG